ncbi:MAG: nuclear transport factor 2 family protein [Actinomycetota bacterium]
MSSREGAGVVNSTLRDTILRAAVDHVAEHGPDTLSFRKLAADAWLASDLEKVLASYHDDIELHYMGESPLAGTHRGRDAAFAALGQASVRTSRKLITVEDVLVGDSLGALIAVEDLGNPPRRVRRVLLYRVQDEKLRECWLFDENQRFIDDLWSKQD